jgi:hypothetical protein
MVGNVPINIADVNAIPVHFISSLPAYQNNTVDNKLAK